MKTARPDRALPVKTDTAITGMVEVDLLDEFLKSRRSENTRGAYGRDLTEFFRGFVRPGRGGVVPDGPGPDGPGPDGSLLDCQQVIGYVDGVGHSTPVSSPFRGKLMGLMAHAGERVREGQPVAWLRLA